MPERSFVFTNRGLVLKVESGSLQPGQLAIMSNVDSSKEGAVNPRGGSKRFIGDLPSGTNWLLPLSLAKLTTGGGDAVDPRYVGEQSNIWRVTGPYSHDVLVSTGLGLNAIPEARWGAQAYNSGSSGNPFMYFAHPVRMLKDDSTFTPLRRWGIPPPVIPASMTLGGSVTPGPDVTGGLPYTYLYTFRNPQTGAEGNPCALPVDSATISPVNQAVVVKFWGAAINPVGADIGDVALQGLGSVAIYRAGGSFADNIYRFVGYAENPGYVGALPQFDNYTDNAPDISLINARSIEFDNDMPVTSSLPVPFVGTIQSQDLSVAAPFIRLFMSSYPNAGADPSMQTFFTPGSVVTVGVADNAETCIVFRVGTTVAASANYIDVFLQNGHSLLDQVQCDANAGKPCDLICLYQDALLLAGDPNNPFVVYRSKSGRPDSFPVVDLEDGNAHQLNVGNPSNPIMGITEFNGEVVCLNLKSIFVFLVLNGTMLPPQATPSDRGMIAKNCWCKVGNEIWFLSYDGLYSWSGGNSQIRSEAIKSIFNSTSMVLGDQTYYPMSYDPVRLLAFYIQCIDQEVWLHYVTVPTPLAPSGQTQVLRYQILYDRWLPASIPDGIGAMMTETDTGRLIVGIQDNSGTPAGFLQQQLVGSSDSWVISENDGKPIGWNLQTQYIYAEEKTRTVQFTELVIEILNPLMGAGDFINFNLSYDFLTDSDGSATADPVDAFQITAASPKRTFVYFPLQRSSTDGTALGKEAMAACLKVFANTVNPVQIFSWTMRYNPLQEKTKNSILDWQSLGSPNDKQLYCLAMEFDPQGQQVTLFLDVIAGVPGNQVPIAQQIVLQPAVWTSLLATLNVADASMSLSDVTGVAVGTIIQIDKELLYVTALPTGSLVPVVRGYLGTAPAFHVALPTVPAYSIGRVKQVFPIVDNVICKAVRLRPLIPGQAFDIFSWEFEPIEKYPPDIVYFSELTDVGSPYDKFFNQLALSVDTGDVTVTVGLELDGTIVFTFPVNTNRFTRYRNITCPSMLTGVNARILPQLPLPAGAKFQLFDIQYVTTPADEGPVKHSTDWDALGTDFDKQLQTITFDYDATAGDISFQIEELTGINGDQEGQGMTVTLSATARGRQSFAFTEGHIVKMIRVHPTGGTVPLSWKSWGYAVTKIDFPPNYIYFTDLTDNGQPFLKYYNQVILEVNTNNVPVTVGLELDGVIAWSFTVTSTVNTRRQAFVCPNQLSGINARLVVATPLAAGSCFQLWGGQAQYVTEPADKGPVTHSYDWDSIGWPYDKRLKSIVFEYSGEAGDVIFQMETIAGINGVNHGPTLTFPLIGTSRAKQQFGIDGVIAKMIRVSPTTAPALDFKSWRYDIIKEDFPPDFILTTEKTVFGYACEKVARNLELDIDTGGVQATIQLWADGVLKQTFQVTTTVNDRSRIIATQSNLIGREWWLELTPGPLGKTQLFSWNLNVVREPCSVSYMDTYEQNFSYPGFKWLKMGWIEYQSAQPITVKIFVDNGALFVTMTLPAHPVARDVERFYFAPIDNTNQFLNKSKKYRVQISAADGTTFKMYSDSVLEWAPVGAEQRMRQFLLSEQQQLPVA